MPNQTKIQWTFLTLASVLLTLACSSGSKAPSPSAAPPDVQVVEVHSQDVPIEGEWVGTLDGMVNAKIKAQVSGYLLRRNYQEGTRVRLGQPLFELDPRSFEAQLSQARAQLAQARGQLAQATGQRSQSLAMQSQAKSQLLQAQALLQQARGQRAQAQASRIQAGVNQRKAQLDEDRYRPLATEKAVTQQEYDNAVQANLSAKAQLQVADAQIQSGQGTVASAQAQVETARSAIQSALAQTQTAEASMLSAQGQVEAAQAQVQTAEINLGFTKIVSPIDGIAGIATAQVGDLVGPNSETLTTVSTVDPIKVNFDIPEREYMESARPGAGLATHTAKFQLIRADGSLYPRAGRFQAEDRNLSISTGAVRLTALFPNPDALLRPGQYARVRAVRYVEKKVTMVPQRAVSELQDRYQVAVVESGNKVALRAVKVGPRLGSQWVIRSGLKDGETVVAVGIQKATQGAVVHPVPYVEAK